MIYDDMDDLVPNSQEEASLYQAIWDLDYFLKQGMIKIIDSNLSDESKKILKEFYVGKC